MKYAHEDIGDERARTHLGVAPGRVTKAVLVFFLMGTLLNGEHLLEQAQLMPYGSWRDICIAVVRPVAIASKATCASAPRHWLEEWPARFAGEE